MKFALIFPGQGSQYIGMGREIYDNFKVAKDVFQEVDDVLKQNLSKIIFEGPSDELTLTENAQPALMAVSLATYRVLTENSALSSANASFVAGHSLGEYSALAASNALSISDAARLLKIRGQAMQAAVPLGAGSMAAILGATLDQVEEIVQFASVVGICEIANDNSEGQVVITGEVEAINTAIDHAIELGKKAVKLTVSAPFHSSLIKSAAIVMQDALLNTKINVPASPLVSNVEASMVTDPKLIKELLVTQVTARVRWRESILYMKDQGVNTFIEVGAGKVLTGLLRRIDRSLSGYNVETPHDIDQIPKQ